MKILFVCLGNICRSPTAEEVIRVQAKKLGLDWTVESCGLGDWHIGKAAFTPMIESAEKKSIDLSKHVARCIRESDFHEFDILVAMDNTIYDCLTSALVVQI